MEYLMDGLSVNWKVLSEFKKETEEAGLYKLINIRSCNLCVVHGALQSVTESTSWNFKNIMTGTYQVLKDSARCGDCISVTGSTVFPLQFCPTQWVNFSDSRGIDQLGLDSIMVVFPLFYWTFPLLSRFFSYMTHWNWLSLVCHNLEVSVTIPIVDARPEILQLRNSHYSVKWFVN